jgi:diguanylate cyclase (GGDEF)-like protein
MDSALPVMVVDDARFSRVIITKSLADAGFRDVRYAASADAALSQLEERPADVVIADWIMPGIDGLEMTRRIREMDEVLEHYTYVMLLSGQEEQTAITRAFEEGVDDFVSKSALRTHLMPRIWAACRTAGFNNGLLSSNRELRQQIATLERRNMIDPLTGLGNERFTDRTLSDVLRQVASRGGAACVVLIALRDYADLAADMDPADVNRVIRATAARLEHLVRPMDVVTRIRPDTFSVLVHQDGIEQCRGSCFTRIRRELETVKVETVSGVVRVRVAMAVGAAQLASGIPTPDELVDYASARLREAAGRDDEIVDGVWSSAK